MPRRTAAGPKPRPRQRRGVVAERPPRRPPRTMPAEVRDAPDRIERVVWIGERIRRFRPLVSHPWFPAIFGRMAAGSSTWRIARWLAEALPANDPLRQIGFDALYSRLKRFRRLLPDGIEAGRSYLDERYAAIGAGIDELEELDTLIRYQKARIDAKAEQEAAFPIPLEQMGREVDRLARLLAVRRDTAVMLGSRALHPMPPTPAAAPPQAPASALEVIERIVRGHPELYGEFVDLLERFDDFEQRALALDRASNGADGGTPDTATDVPDSR